MALFYLHGKPRVVKIAEMGGRSRLNRGNLLIAILLSSTLQSIESVPLGISLLGLELEAL